MVSICTITQDLLDEMGRFLGDTLLDETLSMSAEKQRVVLLQRLQPHIQRTGTDVTSVSNVVIRKKAVNGTKGSTFEERYEDVPTAISRTSNLSSNSGQSDDNPNIKLSFKELKCAAAKHGPLLRKERGTFSEQWRKYWTVLHMHVLYLYPSERSAKPSAAVDIQGYVARPMPNPKYGAKSDLIFEIKCPGKTAYEFTARTVKDMEQWVAAVCEESVKYVRNTPSPLPHLNVNTSVSRRAESVLADEDGEYYDDAGSLIRFNEKSEDVYNVHQSHEEIYHDISYPYEDDPILESKTNVEVACEETYPPPLPHRLPPSVSRDDLTEEEEIYDDIGGSEQNSQFLNVVGVDGVARKNTKIQTGTDSKWGHKRLVSGTGSGGGYTKVQPETVTSQIKARSQPPVEHEMQCNAEEREDELVEPIYAELGANDEPPKLNESSVLQHKYSITNRDNIQTRARIREESLFKDGNQPKTNTPHAIQPKVSAIQKQLKNTGKSPFLPMPETPTASVNSKANTLKQTHQVSRNLYRQNEITVPTPNTSHSNQPPALPPRIPYKR